MTPRTNRRRFIQLTAGTLGGVLIGTRAFSAAAPQRAAVIGATGRGDYGHGIDVIFNGRAGIELVALSDPDAAGRARAAEKLKAPRQYADYRELLAKEKPQLVALCPRQTIDRHTMALDILRAGAHIYSEKPFTSTLAEADELLAESGKRGLKIAVAHQTRMMPNIVHLKKSATEGLLGDLLEIHAWGKQDARAGGEDMMVLGTHMFDLMRLYAGDATWCTARVLTKGRDITVADARLTKDYIGPVAGDEIHAQFAFANGVNGTFTSRNAMRLTTGNWGIELIGSKARAKINANIPPRILHCLNTDWKPDGRTDIWKPIPGDPLTGTPDSANGFPSANSRLVDNWLASIAANHEPECSGRNAMKAIEMVMAVYHAGLSGRRVALPLVDRSHPLAATK